MIEKTDYFFPNQFRTLPGTREGDTGTGPPPPPPVPHTGQVKQRTRAGNVEWHGPHGTALPAPHVVRAQNSGGGGGGANTAGAPPHQHQTGTQRAPEGQQHRARETHRPHGMAYQQARTKDLRTGQPATHTAKGAREGRRVGGGGGDEKRHWPRPPDLLRAPRKHQQGTRALHPPRQ